MVTVTFLGIGNSTTITVNGPTTTTRTVGTLTNGTAYTFTVAAFNVVGAGVGAVSNSVTITADGAGYGRRDRRSD